MCRVNPLGASKNTVTLVSRNCFKPSRGSWFHMVDFRLPVPYTRNTETAGRLVRSLVGDSEPNGKQAATEEMQSHHFMLKGMILALVLALGASLRVAERTRWKPVAFAIVKFNAQAPKSSN